MYMTASNSKKLAARIITKLPKVLKPVAKMIVKTGPGSAANGKRIIEDRIDKAIWGKNGRKKKR